MNFVDAELLESDPELAEVLSRLDGAIDEATMAAMNAQVDVDGMSAQEVAHQFLVNTAWRLSKIKLVEKPWHRLCQGFSTERKGEMRNGANA